MRVIRLGLLCMVWSGVCPSRFLFQTYLSLGGGGSVTGAHLVPMGHSRSVHMYLRGHERPISARVCVIGIHIDIGREHGLVSAVRDNTCVSM